MGALESERSLSHRISAALDWLERLTKQSCCDDKAHIIPKTVEEAVERLKRQVAKHG
ncbi:MAG: hypothetical protein K2X44_09460 [Magnetospirillum sp.]|nr:hypothetical protein [Magnetospirillum sp.]